MQLSKLRLKLNYLYHDYYRGLIYLVPMTIAVLILWMKPQTLTTELWFLCGVFLPGLAPVGDNKIAQSAYFWQFSLLAYLSSSSLTLLYPHLPNLSLYVALAFFIFIILCTPLLWPKLNNSASILSLFSVLACIYPPSSPLSISQTLWHLMPILYGTGICWLCHLLLPTVKLAPLPYRLSRYFFIRRLRIALAVGVVLAIGHYLQLQRPWWAALAILVVSQTNLGATIRKASFRLAGTFIGILIAIPVAQSLFYVHPYSRFLILLLFAFAFVIIKRHEVIAIIIITTCLGAIYYVAYPGETHVVGFFMERLLETAFGVVTILLFESLFFPRSVIDIMRSHTCRFWHSLAEHLQHNNIQQLRSESQTIVDQLKNNLVELRFDPIALMSRRLRFVYKGIAALEFHRDLLLKQLQQQPLSESDREQLIYLYQVIGLQTQLPKRQRLQEIPQIKQNILEIIKSDKAHHVKLYQHLIHILDLSETMLKTTGLSLRQPPRQSE